MTSQNDIQPVRSRLIALRARARWMLIVSAGSVLLCAAIAAALSAGLLDYVVRLPSWFRVLMLAGGIGAAVVAIRKWVLPAIGFRPPLTEVALRIENSRIGEEAGLRGLLASGLELSEEAPAAAEPTRSMADHVVQEAARKFLALRGGASALSPVRVRHSLLTLGACIFATAAIGLVSGIQHFTVGIRRVITPWVDVQWPKRTGIADAMAQDVHALGAALPLRAAVVRTDQRAGQTRVAAKYRVISSQGQTPLVRVLLTGQGRTIGLTSGETGPATGELFERLIEPSALAPGATASADRPAELEYWFETEDDQTLPRRIKLVDPPAIATARMQITPPPYASGRQGDKVFASGAVDLGQGNDQGAVVGPVLAGSLIELHLTLNKSVPVPPTGPSEAEVSQRQQWLATTIPDVAWGPSFSVAFDGPRWILSWTADSTVRIPIRPVDQYGLRAVDEVAYSVDVSEDRLPSAAVIDPREDESVLPTAVIDLIGEGRDDVGVKSVELVRQSARPTRGSIGAAPEAAGETTTLSVAESKGKTQETVAAVLDLAVLQPRPQPGEEVWITAVVTDNYSINGALHEPVRSSPRKLRIIREEELIEQVRAELTAVRRTTIRLHEEQTELRKSIADARLSAEDSARQQGLSQRIATQKEAVERLSRRAERNKLSDEGLTGLLQDLAEHLGGAAKDSEQASGQMDAARHSQPPELEQEVPLSPEQTREISKTQEAVQEQLERVAEALDRGEDSWLASRSLQRMIQQQKDLRAQTQRLGDQTMGKRAEDLTSQERAELAEVAERQQRLSDQVRQTLDQIDQRVKQMEKADPAQAEGMQRAAERGRQEQVPEKMQEAARNAERNQTSEANRQQDEALESMEQMAQDMQEAQRRRDARLSRTLADLLQSLQRLIEVQTAELEALAAAIPDSKFAGLDRPLMELRQNTLDVAEKASADRATAKIGEIIGKAAEAQGKAIASLRAAPVDSDATEQAENDSLRLLRQARDDAKKAAEEAAKRDQDRKRDELRKVYREVLELQVGIQADTEPFLKGPVERRDRSRVRVLGERQEDVRARLEELKNKTEGLADAQVFGLAHQRLETATMAAGKKLRAAQPDRTVGRNQDTAVRVLKALVEALSEKSFNDDEFREEEDGGDGGGGAGDQGGNQGQPRPLIPPLAELRLLRGMQMEAAEVTRSLDDAKDHEDLPALGDYQRSLAERGKELIKQLERQGGGLSKPPTPGSNEPGEPRPAPPTPPEKE